MALKLYLCQLDPFHRWRPSSILALASREFPEEPLETIRPVDQVKMAYTYQGPFIIAPLARLNARGGLATCTLFPTLRRCIPNQSIVDTLYWLDNRM